MYGPSLPLLYVIAVIHYFIYWNVARYSLVYKLQLPPSMDYHLTKNCLQLLKLAPLFYLFNTFWFMGNKQIFHGWVNEIMTTDDYMRSGHTVSTSATLNQAAPVGFMAILLTSIYVLQRYFKRTM